MANFYVHQIHRNFLAIKTKSEVNPE